MKILIFRTVAHELNVSSYNSQEIGLARAFVKLGHDCDIVYYTWKSERNVILLEENKNVARLLWRKGIPLIRNGLYPQLAKKSFLNKYDLIITNEYNQIMSLVVCKQHTVGKTFVYNGPYYNMFKIPFMDRIYDKLFKKAFINNCDLFLAKSVLSEEYLRDRGIENVKVIGVALDESKFESVEVISESTKVTLEYMKENECLLYVGTLSKRKNTSFLFEMFSELCRINSDIKLVIVGQGKKEYVDECVLRLEGNAKERIFFVERIPNNEISVIYKACVGFILPSVKEIFGMVLLEAMYFGCNVYSSATGGALTLINNNINGYVFTDFNAKKWANIINETSIPKLRKLVGSNAHDTIVKNYTWLSIATKIIDEYNYKLEGNNE